MKICAFDGCERKFYAKGYCRQHWQLQKQGKPLAPLRETKRRTEPHSPRRSEEVLFRDDEGNKQCVVCRNWKTEDDFHKQSKTYDGLAARCRECNQRILREHRYGMPLTSIQKMLEDQGFACAICKKDISDNFFVDHDHACCNRKKHDATCGKCVRGILCGSCNMGLGSFRDNTNFLSSAISYLEAFSGMGGINQEADPST